MSWRRLSGSTLMILGAAAIMAAILIATVFMTRFVDWANPAAMLRSAASVTLPALLGGLGFMTGGRWIYGGWRNSAPVINAIACSIGAAGLILACALSLMLIFVIATGMKPEDMDVVITLAIGVSASIAMILLGLRMRVGSGRRYLD